MKNKISAVYLWKYDTITYGFYKQTEICFELA